MLFVPCWFSIESISLLDMVFVFPGAKKRMEKDVLLFRPSCSAAGLGLASSAALGGHGGRCGAGAIGKALRKRASGRGDVQRAEV